MGINVEKTKQYYESIRTENMCSCDYCKNYYLLIKDTYPDISDYLSSLGIDIEKPFEISPLEPDQDGMIEYCICQYIVLGNADIELVENIGNVKIKIATLYPDTNIQDEHFVVDIYPIKLKWIM